MLSCSVKLGSAHTNHLVSRHHPNHEGIWGGGCSGIAPFILNHGTRCMWMVKSTPPPLHHRRKNASTHRTGGWVAPRVGPDVSEKKKSPSSLGNRNAGLQAQSLISILTTISRLLAYVPRVIICVMGETGHRKMYCCFTVPECQNILWILDMLYRMESIHTYIRTYIHTYVRTYVHTYIHTHTCIHGASG